MYVCMYVYIYIYIYITYTYIDKYINIHKFDKLLIIMEVYKSSDFLC